MSKKPVHFEAKCPKCSGVGDVHRNSDYILWFWCNECGYNNSWHAIHAEK